MKNSEFSKCVTQYFTIYLPGLRNVSCNTIYSYRDTFRLFLNYCKDVKKIDLSKFDFDNIEILLIQNFLEWLEFERKNSLSSVNQRLAAIRAFFRYAQCEYPQYYALFNQILNIPFRKAPKAQVKYMTKDILTKYLLLPDQNTISGRRDYTMLCILYDTGARVQELIDLTVRDIRIDSPAVIRLKGKGGKIRFVPLMSQTQKILNDYLLEHNLNYPEKSDYPLFTNRNNEKFSRAGISYIIKKYAVQLNSQDSVLCPEITPHTFRHTKAMHLLQANVNIIYIRDILGHTDVKTTEIYAHADTEMKRKALEKLPPSIPVGERTSWNDDANLLTWLNSIGK